MSNWNAGQGPSVQIIAEEQERLEKKLARWEARLQALSAC
jgi:hypothetical protein